MPQNLTISAPRGIAPEHLQTYVACVNFVAWIMDEQCTEEVTPQMLLNQFNANVSIVSMGQAQGNA